MNNIPNFATIERSPLRCWNNSSVIVHFVITLNIYSAFSLDMGKNQRNNKGGQEARNNVACPKWIITNISCDSSARIFKELPPLLSSCSCGFFVFWCSSSSGEVSGIRPSLLDMYSGGILLCLSSPFRGCNDLMTSSIFLV